MNYVRSRCWRFYLPGRVGIAQSPTAQVAGRVTDQSGAIIVEITGEAPLADSERSSRVLPSLPLRHAAAVREFLQRRCGDPPFVAIRDGWQFFGLKQAPEIYRQDFETPRRFGDGQQFIIWHSLPFTLQPPPVLFDEVLDPFGHGEQLLPLFLVERDREAVEPVD
jgi:hypothetical protein